MRFSFVFVGLQGPVQLSKSPKLEKHSENPATDAVWSFQKFLKRRFDLCDLLLGSVAICGSKTTQHFTMLRPPPTAALMGEWLDCSFITPQQWKQHDDADVKVAFWIENLKMSFNIAARAKHSFAD